MDNPCRPTGGAEDSFAHQFAIPFGFKLFNDPIHRAGSNAEQRRQLLDGKLVSPQLRRDAVQLICRIDTYADLFRNAEVFFIDDRVARFFVRCDTCQRADYFFPSNTINAKLPPFFAA